MDTAQTNTDLPAFQATRASAGAASRLSVLTGSERGLHIELPFPAPGKAPPTTVENKKDSELDEVDTEVSKKVRPTSVDITELSASAASVSLSLTKFSDLESRELIKTGFDFDAVKEDLPYLQVHASVLNVDGSEMPALVFRMWIGTVQNWVRREFLFQLPSAGSAVHPARTRTPSEDLQRTLSR